MGDLGSCRAILKELSDRDDIIKTMHRALATHGLEEARGSIEYVASTVSGRARRSQDAFWPKG